MIYDDVTTVRKVSTALFIIRDMLQDRAFAKLSRQINFVHPNLQLIELKDIFTGATKSLFILHVIELCSVGKLNAVHPHDMASVLSSTAQFA